MPGDVTQLLSAIDSGNPKAAEELLPLVYEELRRLAAHKMPNERPGQTSQATALVHEAWIRLAGSDRQRWTGRTHFLGAAAEAMRLILIDKARRRAALKRGEDMALTELDESRVELAAPADEVLAVHEAIDALAAQEPVSAQVVKLRYFVGMSMPEIAEALEVSLSTVERHWAYARAWLRSAVRGEHVSPRNRREMGP
jgi:RNA polymerase sigma factor (TIGR02999 family)